MPVLFGATVLRNRLVKSPDNFQGVPSLKFIAGENRSDYSPYTVTGRDDLVTLANNVSESSDVYFNNDALAHAPVNAARLRE
jgi:uncharacterized protein YecE (DUF72 family)